MVNGEMLTVQSALANLRAACATYGISSSGSKAKCFKRLMEHQQKLQMQTVMNASRDALNAEVRVPRSPTLAEPPDEAIQARHRLTHVPYETWCQPCVAHRARADANHRDGMVSEGDCPVISFDFFYTKAGENVKEEETLVAMVMIDNKTGYLGVVPLSSKAQFDLLTKELIAFTSTLGYSSIQLRCDNEPTIVQVAKLTVQARQQMGLETRFETPAAYSHGNGLAENAVQRIRGVACSLMHSLQGRLKVSFGTGHALWSWCLRHASWIINRYNPYKGITSHELVYGKAYTGQVCEYGEPVFGYVRSPLKGNARWERMLFLGKEENQDSFLLFNGGSLVLTRSVRRTKTDWRTHLNYYLQFNLFSWQFKVGFGGRVVPTKRRGPVPRTVTFAPPSGAVAPSQLVDEEAEAVKQKAVEERREEKESSSMAAHDRPQNVQHEVQFADESEFQEETAKHPAPSTPAPEVADLAMPSSSASTSAHVPVDPGLMAPVTPQDVAIAVDDSPRHSATTRSHGPEGDELETKRAKVDELKKQRINVLSAEHANMVRAISFGDETYHTLDSYDTEFQDDGSKRNDEEEMNDLWKDEEELYFAGTPEALWHDGDLKVTPDPPEEWIELLADQLEISRLLEMKVLVRKEEYSRDVLGSLTTVCERLARKALC